MNLKWSQCGLLCLREKNFNWHPLTSFLAWCLFCSISHVNCSSIGILIKYFELTGSPPSQNPASIRVKKCKWAQFRCHVFFSRHFGAQNLVILAEFPGEIFGTFAEWGIKMQELTLIPVKVTHKNLTGSRLFSRKWHERLCKTSLQVAKSTLVLILKDTWWVKCWIWITNRRLFTISSQAWDFSRVRTDKI